MGKTCTADVIWTHKIVFEVAKSSNHQDVITNNDEIFLFQATNQQKERDGL